MERVDIICVGTLKEKYLKEMCAEYEKRLSRFCKLTVTEIPEVRLPEAPSPETVARALEEEAAAILRAVPAGAYKIALCIEGKSLSSEQFADSLESAMGQCGKTALLIGSSYGLSPSIKRQSDLQLSLSRLTLPHQVARCLLHEQIYRAYKIRFHEKYHK